MGRSIKIIPIKHETKKKGHRKYLVDVILWGCDLELTKEDGTKNTVKSVEYMSLQNLKREAITEAKKYSDYILTKKDFYFK